MKFFLLLEACGLAFLISPTITALPVDTAAEDHSKRETSCVALGDCPGQSPGQSPGQNPGQSPEPLSLPTLLPSSISLGLPPLPPSSTVPPTTTSPSSTVSIYGNRKPPDPTLSIQRAAMTPYLYACNKAQQKAVKTAWQEAGKIAEAHSKWTPPGIFSSGSYQPAMDLYLGDKSRLYDPFIGTGPLMKNILRQKGIHDSDSNWSPYWSYAYIYCDESKVPNKPEKPAKPQCNAPNNPDKKVTAYTFSDDGSIFGWNAKYIVLCPRFFDDDVLTLSDMTNKAKSNSTAQMVMEPWRKTKPRIIFHETYHWGPAEVSDPRCDLFPEVYDPARVVNLASTKNIDGSKTNAESWAQAAMAIYVQQTFNLKSPPVPEKQYGKNSASVDDTTFEDDLEEQFLDTAPDWFQSPVDLGASSYSPNMTDVVLLSDISD